MRTRKQNSILRRSNKMEYEKSGGYSMWESSMEIPYTKPKLISITTAELGKSVTEAGRKYMKDLFDNLPPFLRDNKSGKQIFSEIDPYGEESWEE